MTPVLIGKGLVLGGWPSKIEVIWVLGIYIYDFKFESKDFIGIFPKSDQFCQYIRPLPGTKNLDSDQPIHVFFEFLVHEDRAAPQGFPGEVGVNPEHLWTAKPQEMFFYGSNTDHHKVWLDV